MCNNSPSVLFLKIEKLLRKKPVQQFSFFHKAKRLQPAISTKANTFTESFSIILLKLFSYLPSWVGVQSQIFLKKSF